MEKRTRFYLILFAVLFVLCAGLFFFLTHFSAGGCVAEIRIDGALYKEIDLNAVAVPYTETITTEYGTNVISVRHGGISVAEADCRDQICVHQGEIADSVVPIVCLPHRLVIQILED